MHEFSIISRISRQCNTRFGKKKLPAIILFVESGPLVELEHKIAILPKGSWVILRAYDLPDREHLAGKLVQYCRKYSVKLLIGKDRRLALKLGAFGVHLPEYMIKTPSCGRNNRKLVTTAAVHSLAAVQRVSQLKVEAAFFSPVFTTLSHPTAKPQGMLHLRKIIKKSDCPIYPLGGISSATIRRLQNLSLPGVAGMRFGML